MYPRGHCKRTEKETLPFILGMSLLKRKGVRWLHPATEKRKTKKELKMKVYKFGGTSVGTVERMKHVAELISESAPKIVVLSATAGVAGHRFASEAKRPQHPIIIRTNSNSLFIYYSLVNVKSNSPTKIPLFPVCNTGTLLPSAFR